MNTFHQLWMVNRPEEAKRIIEEQRKEFSGIEPANLEEQAISLIGRELYEILVKGYTEKQWGKKATELPAFIIRRLPIRFAYNNNYFNDVYQGIPIGGYNKLIGGLLKNIEVQINANFFDDRSFFENSASKIVFTGRIDEYYEFQLGFLDYRSLRFEEKILDENNYQGCAAINYTDSITPYTRIIEHKFFEFGNQDKTIITKEYPLKWKAGLEPYYPINDKANNDIYNKYKELSAQNENVIFGGRLAEYKYYDMHQIIEKLINIKL